MTHPLNRFTVLLLLLLSALPRTGTAVTPQLFDQAGAAYSTGEFDRAAELYEELIADIGYTPNILYNLANSYAGAGKTGAAILNYERAARLAPGDSDILGNLHSIKNNQGLFEPEPTPLERLASLAGMNQWLVTGLTAFGVGATLLLLALPFHIAKRIQAPVLATCTVLLVLSWFCATLHYRGWQAFIVMEPDTRLTISPFAGASSVGEIKEGSTVFALERHGNFIRMRDESGRKGWLAQTAVQPIIPVMEEVRQ